MELWDVLTAEGEPTGRTKVRGQKLLSGEYHLFVHIWIQNDKKEYLIQKRADHLEWQPGVWAITGGSVLAGEDSLTGAIRETSEEVGINLQAAQMTFIARLQRFDGFADIWLATGDTHQWGDVHLGPEVSQIRWVTKQQIQQMISNGEFFAFHYLDMLPD